MCVWWGVSDGYFLNNNKIWLKTHVKQNSDLSFAPPGLNKNIYVRIIPKNKPNTLYFIIFSIKTTFLLDLWVACVMRFCMSMEAKLFIEKNAKVKPKHIGFSRTVKDMESQQISIGIFKAEF